MKREVVAKDLRALGAAMAPYASLSDVEAAARATLILAGIVGREGKGGIRLVYTTMSGALKRLERRESVRRGCRIASGRRA